MAKRCKDICQDFEKHRPTRMVHEWKVMKHRWEVDPLQPDPYTVVEKGRAVIYTAPSLLIAGLHSLEPQFRKTKACRD